MTTKEVCFDLDTIPENLLANKIKKDVIDKLLTCSTKEEIQEQLVKIVNDNYQSLDIEQLRLGSASIGPIIDSFVACALDATTEELTTTQITVADLLKNAIDLVCDFPAFPKVPTPFPVIDISGEFLKQLLISLLRLVVRVLFSIIQKILQLIIQICSGTIDFGAENILQLLADSVSGGINEAINTINDTFAIFGIDANGVPATSLINGQGCQPPIDTTAIKATSLFMEDLSSVLTPLEICNFFENIPTPESFKVVEELMQFEYPAMAAVFNTRTKIRELFKLLGKKIDPKICKLIRDNAEQITTSPDLCFTEDGNEIRRNLLSKRDLTDQQIEDLLQRERDRQKENLSKIANLLAKIKTDPSKIFGDQQEIFCKNGQPGLVSMEQMPSLINNVNDTTTYLFNLFATVWTKELSYYQSTLITQKKIINNENPVIKKFVPIIAKDDKGVFQTIENATNPDFIKNVSFGSYDLCDEDGNTDVDSLMDAYPDATNEEETGVDVQKILAQTNITDLEDNIGADNVYIVNYIKNEKIANLLFDENYGIINSGSVADMILSPFTKTKFIKDLISTNVDDMSISINLPINFTNVPTPYGLAADAAGTSNIPDFTTIPSDDNIIVYTHGTGSSEFFNESISPTTGLTGSARTSALLAPFRTGS